MKAESSRDSGRTIRRSFSNLYFLLTYRRQPWMLVTIPLGLVDVNHHSVFIVDDSIPWLCSQAYEHVRVASAYAPNYREFARTKTSAKLSARLRSLGCDARLLSLGIVSTEEQERSLGPRYALLESRRSRQCEVTLTHFRCPIPDLHLYMNRAGFYSPFPSSHTYVHIVISASVLIIFVCSSAEDSWHITTAVYFSLCPSQGTLALSMIIPPSFSANSRSLYCSTVCCVL